MIRRPHRITFRLTTEEKLQFETAMAKCPTISARFEKSRFLRWLIKHAEFFHPEIGQTGERPSDKPGGHKKRRTPIAGRQK